MDWLRRTSFIGLGAFAAVSISGCAESTTDSAVAPSEPGTFAWFDLASDDPEVSKDFYETVFGWRFSSKRSGQYWTIKSSGTPLGGMFETTDADASGEIGSQWIPVIGVADAIASSKAAFALGARQIAPPAQTSDGLYSSIWDPTGAALDLYQGSSGLPISESGAVGQWIWADHLSSAPSRVARFYSALLGYQPDRGRDGERVLKLDGKEIGGLVYVSGNQADPNWLPYVAVADLEETLSKAAASGGRLVTRDGNAAVFLDPTGAAIGVIEVEG